MPDFMYNMTEAVPSLRRYARALTRHPDEADDLVQDCLERALRKRALWKPTGPLKGWLFRLMLNIYRNNRKTTATRGKDIPFDSVYHDPVQPPEQPARIAMTEISEALATLPKDQYEALLLVVLEGFSYAEAADILNIPQGTLMSRINRARRALRTMTHEDGAPTLKVVK